MNADPAAQLRLLDLQALDTTLDQLATRRRGLPEHREIDRLTTLRGALRDDVVRVETELSDIAAEQSRIEADIDVVRAREERDRARLASGQGTPKELEGLQHELGSLEQRQSALEDQVLEVMERREEVEARLQQFLGQRAEADDELADITARRDRIYGEIDADADRVGAERSAVAAEVPADLLALYDRLAADKGSGAAALRHGRCEGCHLALAGQDLNTLRAAAPELVARCEECGRILVRTAESGL